MSARRTSDTFTDTELRFGLVMIRLRIKKLRAMVLGNHKETKRLGKYLARVQVIFGRIVESRVNTYAPRYVANLIT